MRLRARSGCAPGSTSPAMHLFAHRAFALCPPRPAPVRTVAV